MRVTQQLAPSWKNAQLCVGCITSNQLTSHKYSALLSALLLLSTSSELKHDTTQQNNRTTEQNMPEHVKRRHRERVLNGLSVHSGR
jgi:hypothetical protein